MITKSTTIDQIEIGKTYVQVRLASLILDDGQPITDPMFHRFALTGADTVEPTIAVVQAHLPQFGREPIGEADLDRIRAHAALVWPAE